MYGYRPGCFRLSEQEQDGGIRRGMPGFLPSIHKPLIGQRHGLQEDKFSGNGVTGDEIVKALREQGGRGELPRYKDPGGGRNRDAGVAGSRSVQKHFERFRLAEGSVAGRRHRRPALAKDDKKRAGSPAVEGDMSGEALPEACGELAKDSGDRFVSEFIADVLHLVDDEDQRQNCSALGGRFDQRILCQTAAEPRRAGRQRMPGSIRSLYCLTCHSFHPKHGRARRRRSPYPGRAGACLLWEGTDGCPRAC